MDLQKQIEFSKGTATLFGRYTIPQNRHVYLYHSPNQNNFTFSLISNEGKEEVFLLTQTNFLDIGKNKKLNEYNKIVFVSELMNYIVQCAENIELFNHSSNLFIPNKPRKSDIEKFKNHVENSCAEKLKKKNFK